MKESQSESENEQIEEKTIKESWVSKQLKILMFLQSQEQDILSELEDSKDKYQLFD